MIATRLCSFAAAILLITTSGAADQRNAILLLHCNQPCVVAIDGERLGRLDVGEMRKAAVIPGQHIVVATVNGKVWQRTVEADEGKQKVIEIAGVASGKRPQSALGGSPGVNDAANSLPRSKSSTKQGGGSASHQPSGEWIWKSEQTTSSQIHGVTCPIYVSDQLNINLTSSDSSIWFDHFKQICSHASNACLDKVEDEEVEETSSWAAPVTISPSGEGFVFSGKLNHCEHCSYSEVRGSFHIEAEELILKLDIPTQMQYRMSKQQR